MFDPCSVNSIPLKLLVVGLMFGPANNDARLSAVFALEGEKRTFSD